MPGRDAGTGKSILVDPAATIAPRIPPSPPHGEDQHDDDEAAEFHPAPHVPPVRPHTSAATKRSGYAPSGNTASETSPSVQRVITLLGKLGMDDVVATANDVWKSRVQQVWQTQFREQFHLSEAEAFAILAFTVEAQPNLYSEVGPLMDCDSVAQSKEMHMVIRLLRSGIRKLPAKTFTVAYRGLSVREGVLRDAFDGNSWKEGNFIEFARFSSFSTSWKTGATFSGATNVDGILLKVQNGIFRDISALSAMPKENELLEVPPTKYKIEERFFSKMKDTLNITAVPEYDDDHPRPAADTLRQPAEREVNLQDERGPPHTFTFTLPGEWRGVDVRDAVNIRAAFCHGFSKLLGAVGCFVSVSDTVSIQEDVSARFFARYRAPRTVGATAENGLVAQGSDIGDIEGVNATLVAAFMDDSATRYLLLLAALEITAQEEVLVTALHDLRNHQRATTFGRVTEPHARVLTLVNDGGTADWTIGVGGAHQEALGDIGGSSMSLLIDGQEFGVIGLGNVVAAKLLSFAEDTGSVAVKEMLNEEKCPKIRLSLALVYSVATRCGKHLCGDDRSLSSTGVSLIKNAVPVFGVQSKFTAAKFLANTVPKMGQRVAVSLARNFALTWAGNLIVPQYSEQITEVAGAEAAKWSDSVSVDGWDCRERLAKSLVGTRTESLLSSLLHWRPRIVTKSFISEFDTIRSRTDEQVVPSDKDQVKVSQVATTDHGLKRITTNEKDPTPKEESKVVSKTTLKREYVRRADPTKALSTESSPFSCHGLHGERERSLMEKGTITGTKQELTGKKASEITSFQYQLVRFTDSLTSDRSEADGELRVSRGGTDTLRVRENATTMVNQVTFVEENSSTSKPISATLLKRVMSRVTEVTPQKGDHFEVSTAGPEKIILVARLLGSVDVATAPATKGSVKGVQTTATASLRFEGAREVPQGCDFENVQTVLRDSDGSSHSFCVGAIMHRSSVERVEGYCFRPVERSEPFEPRSVLGQEETFHKKECQLARDYDKTLRDKAIDEFTLNVDRSETLQRVARFDAALNGAFSVTSPESGVTRFERDVHLAGTVFEPPKEHPTRENVLHREQVDVKRQPSRITGSGLCKSSTVDHINCTVSIVCKKYRDGDQYDTSVLISHKEEKTIIRNRGRLTTNTEERVTSHTVCENGKEVNDAPPRPVSQTLLSHGASQAVFSAAANLTTALVLHGWNATAQSSRVIVVSIMSDCAASYFEGHCLETLSEGHYRLQATAVLLLCKAFSWCKICPVIGDAAREFSTEALPLPEGATWKSKLVASVQRARQKITHGATPEMKRKWVVHGVQCCIEVLGSVGGAISTRAGSSWLCRALPVLRISGGLAEHAVSDETDWLRFLTEFVSSAATRAVVQYTTNRFAQLLWTPTTVRADLFVSGASGVVYSLAILATQPSVTHLMSKLRQRIDTEWNTCLSMV